MLGIILLIFMGRQFYNLAFDYNKNKWLWAILSIVIFYALQFIVGIAAGLIFGEETFEKSSGSYWGMILTGLGVSVVGAIVLYQYLKHRWQRELVLVNDNPDLLDANIQDNNDFNT